MSETSLVKKWKLRGKLEKLSAFVSLSDSRSSSGLMTCGTMEPWCRSDDQGSENPRVSWLCSRNRFCGRFKRIHKQRQSGTSREFEHRDPTVLLGRRFTTAVLMRFERLYRVPPYESSPVGKPATFWSMQWLIA
jgi:hypothetical protein